VKIRVLYPVRRPVTALCPVKGIYSIRCITCNNEDVGQSGRDIQIRYKEHINQIRNCNPQPAYANHILQNRHEFGPAETTLRLLKQCNKRCCMNCWEYKYIQEFQRAGRLITEQQTYDFNPLFAIASKEKKRQRELVTPVQYSIDQTREGTQQHQHKAQTSITGKKIQTGDLNSI
jgi:hypothetical protein